MDGKKPINEVEQLKTKLRATWMSGDFGRIATSFEKGAVEFVDRLGLKPGSQVLDVACGTGNLAIPAARSGMNVTGLDIVPDLIDQARAAAEAEKLNVIFEVGDAEAMPYADNSYGVVMSMFGAMFAPRPEVVVEELKRVCVPGGTIAMANWTPAGFIGQMFKTTGRYVPAPAGMVSPLLWGDEVTLAERFSSGFSSVSFTKRTLEFVFPFSPSNVVEHFRKFYGPTLKAFESLDRTSRDALRLDLEELWTKANQATDGTTRVEAEYMDVRAVCAQ